MDKILKHSKRSSIYKNLILIYLISVVPLLFLFFVSNKLALDEMHDQKLNTLQAYLETNKNRLEREVTRIYVSQQAFISNDTKITDLSHRYGRVGGYELGTMVSSIHTSLNHMQNTSALIKDVYLYINTIQRAFATKLYYDDNVTEDEKGMFQLDIESPSLMLTYHNGIIYVGSRMQTRNNAAPMYYLFSELDPLEIEALFSTTEEDIYTIYFSGESIISNDQGGIPAYLVSHLGRESMNPDRIMSTNFKYLGDDYYMVYEYSRDLDGVFIVYAPESVVFGNLQLYTACIWLLALFAAVMILFLILSIYRMVKEPFEKLITLFGKVERGSLDVEMTDEPNNEFGKLMHSFNFMVEKLKLSISQVYEKNTNLKAAELKQLQAQISPHFLYNSFNILTHSISRNNNETALLMSKALSRYFKYITQNNNELDTLKNEFEFAKTYIEIQKLRFGDKITVNFNMIEVDYASMLVPRMIIQPLIENSYKYAFSDIVSGGVLNVYWKANGDKLIITVEDNGPGVSPQALALLRKSLETGDNIGHNGICNVHQRLNLKYQEDFGLRIYSEEENYFKNEIIIPITPNEDKGTE